MLNKQQNPKANLQVNNFRFYFSWGYYFFSAGYYFWKKL